MDKSEALKSLNLTDSAGEAEIRRVFSEKYNHFQYLLTHAPNELLRNVHRRNLEQLDLVRKALLISPAVLVREDSVQVPVSKIQSPSLGDNTIKSSIIQEPVGWLIRHTENKSHTHFALWSGENPIGRSFVVNKRNIQIEDDHYVSRYHAVLLVMPLPIGYAFEIADDGRYNQNAPSSNGTYVNGSDSRLKPNEMRLLKEGDTIQIGTTKLVLRINQSSKSVSGIVEEVSKTQFVRTVVIDL
jgi:hypothetical protein